MTRLPILIALLLATAACGESSAQPATPYWATIKATKVNMRVGPSKEYKIEWVYERKGLPIKILRAKDDGWRFVEDHEGTQGWVHRSMLSSDFGGLVIGKGVAAMRAEPADNSALNWNLEPGVIGKLDGCDAGWCELDVEGRKGFVRADRLWGSGPP